VKDIIPGFNTIKIKLKLEKAGKKELLVPPLFSLKDVEGIKSRP
jgi:hypothetical protein